MRALATWLLPILLTPSLAAAAPQAVYRSQDKILGVDWDRRVVGVIHDGVTPSMLFESLQEEPKNTFLWKNRRSCGLTTTLLQLAIPSRPGRTVRTRKYTYEEQPGAGPDRRFSVYDATRVKFLEYDYTPKKGVSSISILSPVSGAATQIYKLESGQGFLSHCGW